MELIFLDLETTGLDPKRHRIVQLAATVVDAETLNPITVHGRRCGFAADVYTPLRGWDGADGPAVDMHRETGLYQRSQDPATALDIEDVERLLARWLYGQPEPRILAGDSVHFDRAFLYEHMPGVLALFHHRQVDVSTLGVLAKAGWLPKAEVDEPNHHDAMADCLASIEKLKQYRQWIVG